MSIIYDPDTRATIVDSAEIAKYLHVAHPATPTLSPESIIAPQAVVMDFITWGVYKPLAILTDLGPRAIGLSPRRLAHIEKSVSDLFGRDKR